MVTGHLSNAIGIRTGKRVHLDGIEVGEVLSVATSQPAQPGVLVTLRINPEQLVPSEAELVAQQSAMGDMFLDFRTPPKIVGTWKVSGPSPCGGTTLECRFPDRPDIRPTTLAYLGGKKVGQVAEVAPGPPDVGGLAVRMFVDPGITVPQGATLVAQQTVLRDPYLEFQTQARPPMFLPTDGTARVEGTIRPPALLPDDLMRDFREAMGTFQGLDDLVANLTALTAQPPAATGAPPRNLWTALAQFEATAKSLQEQMDDPTSDFRQVLASARRAAEDVRETLTAARKALESADKTMATLAEAGKTFQETGKKAGDAFDKGAALMEKLNKDTDKVVTMVERFDGLVKDIRDGKGTLGRLATDDEAYRALVTLMEDLKTLGDNMNRLVTMWREEGLLSKEK
jgi:ABC-type transporter Mla subunit MlaD